MNLIKYRYWYFAISLLVIVPGVLALIIWGLPLGIDFTGGSLLEVQFKSGTPPTIAQVTTIYSNLSTSTMETPSSFRTKSEPLKSAAVCGATLPALFMPSVSNTITFDFEDWSRSRFTQVATAEPMAVLSSTRPILTRSRFCLSQSWSSVRGLTR